MEDDWDLYAVVRGCSSTSNTTTTTNNNNSTTATTSTSPGVFSLSRHQTEQKNEPFFYFPDLYEPRNGNNIEELHDLLKPFCPKIQPISPHQMTNLPFSPISPLSVLQDLSHQPTQQQQQQQQQQKQQKQIVLGSRNTTTFASSSTTTTRHNPQNPRSKRRKNQMKRVCQVPAEGLSSDMWSWRKYGQKPIKGSPFPRGYYRCSTSKGCLARKQVERNRSDPNMFIVTYTGEHSHPIPTHRNSLAGSTRQKPATSETVTEGDANKPTCSTPISPAASLSPATEKIEVDDEDDEFGGSDLALNDDFFTGLEEITSPVTGDGYSDHFPFPWSANNATTTAAGGV